MPGRACQGEHATIIVEACVWGWVRVGLGVCGSSVHGGTVGVAGCVVVRGAGAVCKGEY